MLTLATLTSFKSSFNSLLDQKASVWAQCSTSNICLLRRELAGAFSDDRLFDNVIQIHYARTSSILEIAAWQEVCRCLRCQEHLLLLLLQLQYLEGYAESAANSFPSSSSQQVLLCRCQCCKYFLANSAVWELKCKGCLQLRICFQSNFFQSKLIHCQSTNFLWKFYMNEELTVKTITITLLWESG